MEQVFTPHSEKQERAIFSDYKITLCCTGVQYGKGLIYSTGVLTPNGYVQAGDVRAGDTLFDRDGKETKVTGVFPQGLQQCYMIQLEGVDQFICDESHLHVIIINGEESVRSTKELLGLKGFHIPTLDGAKECTKITPQKRKETVCFSVDSPTKTFVIENKIITHNTTIGARWLQRLSMLHNDPEDNFIVVAPTYKILNQSSLPEFLRVFEGFGEFKKGDMEFKVYGGGTVYLRTETDPDSIVGIRRVRAIWGDEAGLFRLYFWQNMQGRAAPLNAPIMLTTTPYSLNWMYKELIKPVQQKKRDDILLISAKSKENPYFSTEEYERQKRTMDPRKFKAIFDGQFTKMQGLVYDCVDDSIEIDKFNPEGDVTYYGGIDWGYNDPFVLVIRAVTKSGFHCQVSEFYKTGLIPEEIKTVVKEKMGIYPMRKIWCDPSQPGMIEMLQRAGIPASPAKNDIVIGIGEHYELIKSGRFKILKGTSPHTLDEFENYHYPEPQDLGPDQDAKKDKPVDQHNHVCDAMRYISIHTKNIHLKRSPHIPDDSGREKKEEMPHEIVKRVRRFKPKTFESWS